MVKRCDNEPCAYHQKYGHSVNLSSRSKKAKWHLNLYHKKMGLVVSPVTAPIHRQTAKSRIKPNSPSQKIRLWVSPGTAPLNHLLHRTQTNAHDTFINAWQWSVHQDLIITDQYISDWSSILWKNVLPENKTLPKELQTQALTALTSNFWLVLFGKLGSVSLVG